MSGITIPIAQSFELRLRSLSLPETGGVYAIRNTSTGDLYIGQAVNLRARYRTWNTAMKMRRGVNRFMLEALKTAPSNDWIFSIIVDDRNLSALELFAIESITIKKAMARGVPLLNVAPMRKLRIIDIKLAPKKEPPGLYMGFDEIDTP